MIDYECWAYGLQNQFGVETDVQKWFQDLSSMCEINEVFFYGDFTSGILNKDKIKIHSITSNIIDTSNPTKRKDYTDFIIVGRLYQTVIKDKDNEIDQYVIFSGDGHFSETTSYFKNILNKTVGAYAVVGTLSDQLLKSVSWVKLILPKSIISIQITNSILQNLNEAKNNVGLIPTFRKTVDIVSQSCNIPREDVSKTLSNLILENYIKQSDMIMENGQTIKGLVVDWSFVVSSKLYKAD